MKSLIKFVAENGFTVMLCGYGLIIPGVIASMSFKFTGKEALYVTTPYPGIATTAIILGVAVYFIGRVSLAKQRGRQRREARYRNYASDDDIYTDDAGMDADGKNLGKGPEIVFEIPDKDGK